MTPTDQHNRIKDAQCFGHGGVDVPEEQAQAEPGVSVLAAELPRLTVTEYELKPGRVKDTYCEGKEASSLIIR